ncbi:MAG: hypothetical protein V4496_00795 [Pseudomonadota bacterium]
MKLSNIFFLSTLVGFFIVFLMLFFVILPIHYRHISLEKEQRILNMTEKKAALIAKVMARNSEKISFLQDQLQAKPLLPFIEEALNVSQLSIESIKPDQGNEHNEFHLSITGEYRALLNFLSLLSRQPNTLILTDLSVEKNHMEVILRNDNKKNTATKAKGHLSLLTRLTAALAVVTVPAFSVNTTLALEDVQSPFVSRVFPKNKGGPFQSLEGTHWYLSGEVRKNGILLGIFLEADNHSQSHYFGINLPWENSHWRVANITRHTVIFEAPRKHIRWSLSYKDRP